MRLLLSKKNHWSFIETMLYLICYAPIAQGIEWHTPNVKVAGSNPVRRTSDETYILWETMVYRFFFYVYVSK